MEKLKVLELFAGLGACSKALERLNIQHEIVDAVEIDKYAINSFNAIHGTNFEPQDITTWNKNISVDLIMHGSPCQDFSLAGKQAGGDEGSGTRSSLMYETIRIVEKLKPKYVLWENVKNLLSKKHRHNFDAYLETLEQLGYKNYYQVLNAKDYGIPQSRERVFTISIRNDIDKDFHFPKKQPLELRLKDLLDDKVDEKYYLSDAQVNRIKTSTYTSNNRRIQKKDYCDTLCARDWKDPKCVEVDRLYGIFDNDKSTHQAGSVYDTEGLSPTLDTMQGGWRQPCIQIKNATRQGYLEAHDGDGYYITNIDKKRGTVQKGMIPTLKTSPDIGCVTTDLRIRKLTPKECWRLMGFDDVDFEKAEKINSNTQLYKQAGNSIVVNVLEAIFKELLSEYIADLDKWSDLD